MIGHALRVQRPTANIASQGLPRDLPAHQAEGPHLRLTHRIKLPKLPLAVDSQEHMLFHVLCTKVEVLLNCTRLHQ
eukprot:3987258-Pyramimonas_sp.AAC.1